MHSIDNQTLHKPVLGPNNQFLWIETIPDSIMWPQTSVIFCRILTAIYCIISPIFQNQPVSKDNVFHNQICVSDYTKCYEPSRTHDFSVLGFCMEVPNKCYYQDDKYSNTIEEANLTPTSSSSSEVQPQGIHILPGAQGGATIQTNKLVPVGILHHMRSCFSRKSDSRSSNVRPSV